VGLGVTEAVSLLGASVDDPEQAIKKAAIARRARNFHRDFHWEGDTVRW
jgi:hypothetical protein